MTYLEILVDSVLEIIDLEGMNPVSRIEVNEDVYAELLFSPSCLKQAIGYPVYLNSRMSQPYRIVRKLK